MAEGQADREVVFRLTAETSKEAEKAFADFGKKAEAVQKQMTKAAETQGKQRTAAHARAKKAELDEESKVLGQWFAMQRKQADAREKADKKHLSDKQKVWAKETNEWRKAMMRREAEEKKAADKALARERKQQELRLKEQEKAYKQIASHHQATIEKAGRLNIAGKLRLSEAFETSAEAVMRFSRGFVMLGLAGEENMEKMIRGLVKMQAFFDLVIGGVKFLIRLDRARQGLQQLARASQLREIANRERNLALANLERKAVEGKAAAEVAAAAASGAGGKGAKSAAAGVAGGAAAGAAGAAAGGSASTAVAGAAGFSIAGISLGGLAGAGAVAAGPVLLAWEAVAGLARALGATSKWFESPIESIWEWRDAVTKSKEATEEAKKAELTRASAIALGEAAQAQAAANAKTAAALGEVSSRGALRGYQRRADAMGLTGDDRDLYVARARQKAALGGVWGAQKNLNAARDAYANRDIGAQAEMTTGAGLAEARKAAIQAADRMRQASEDRLTAEKAIAKARIDAADESLRKAQDELKARKDALKAEEDRLKSAEQKFGSMSRSEQRDLIRIKRKADAGGRLSVAEAQKLEGLGTTDASSAASDLFSKRAKAAGFDRFFGKSERGEIDRLKKEAAKLEVDIKDQRELKVTIQRDNDSLARQIGEMIRREMEVADQLLTEKIKEEAQKTKSEINRNIQGFRMKQAQ